MPSDQPGVIGQPEWNSSVTRIRSEGIERLLHDLLVTRSAALQGQFLLRVGIERLPVLASRSADRRLSRRIRPALTRVCRVAAEQRVYLMRLDPGCFGSRSFRASRKCCAASRNASSFSSSVLGT
jgi:hypothetical protein